MPQIPLTKQSKHRKSAQSGQTLKYNEINEESFSICSNHDCNFGATYIKRKEINRKKTLLEAPCRTKKAMQTKLQKREKN